MGVLAYSPKIMLFTIIESFSPQDGDRWKSYCEWRGLNFEAFESIDGILRTNLFTPGTDEDWQHIVNQNFMLHLFTNFDYALKKHKEIGKGDLVGLRFEGHDESDSRFLGYDLIDKYCDVSLLTNWGNDVEIINRSLTPFALISNRKIIEDVQAELFRTNGNDGHVEWCRIVSIYRPI